MVLNKSQRFHLNALLSMVPPFFQRVLRTIFHFSKRVPGIFSTFPKVGLVFLYRFGKVAEFCAVYLKKLRLLRYGWFGGGGCADDDKCFGLTRTNQNIHLYVINHRATCMQSAVMQNRGIGFYMRRVCADARRRAFRYGTELRQGITELFGIPRREGYTLFAVDGGFGRGV